MFTPAVQSTACHGTVCSLQQRTSQPVNVKCVYSSSAPHSQALYSMFTPAVNYTTCHGTVCSFKQCTPQPVTVQYFHSSSALHNQALYSMFTPALHSKACHCRVCSFQQCTPQPVTIQCSHQQCTPQPVTVQCVHFSSALHSLSLYSMFITAVHSTTCHCTGWARSHRTPRQYAPQTQFKFTQHSTARSTMQIGSLATVSKIVHT